MGNQASFVHHQQQQQQNAAAAGAVAAMRPLPVSTAGGEPLESYMREKQRDDHLKNLGFKRSRSIRRSISKRLKRKNKEKKADEADGKPTDATAADANKDRVPSIERLDRNDVPGVAAAAASDKSRQKPVVGEPQPMPSQMMVRTVCSQVRNRMGTGSPDVLQLGPLAASHTSVRS